MTEIQAFRRIRRVKVVEIELEFFRVIQLAMVRELVVALECHEVAENDHLQRARNVPLESVERATDYTRRSLAAGTPLGCNIRTALVAV